MVDAGGPFAQRVAVLLLGVDMAATIVFAVEGATQAANRHLDVFGVLVLAFVTALSGGIVRDLLLGDHPPTTLKTARYTMAAAVAGAVVFVFHAQVNKISLDTIAVMDAIGLSLFAMSGAAKSLAWNTNAVTAALLGVLTGIGGGVVRDLFLGETPIVLRANVYAVAALLGTTIMVTGVKRNRPVGLMMLLGGFACFALRVAAVYGNWNLPHA